MTMTSEETKLIIAQLATLTEGMRGLQRDGDNRDRALEAERVESHASRKDLHDKANDTRDEVAALRSDLRATNTTLETLATTVQTLATTVDTNAIAAAPTIEQFDQVRRLGKVFFWMIGGGGIAAAGTLLVWGETIRHAVAGWLGIKM